MIRTDLVVVGLLVIMFGLVYYKSPTGQRVEYLLTERCTNDTMELCMDCFPGPDNCSSFQNVIIYDGMVLTKKGIDQFEQHSIRHGILYNLLDVSVNNLNRNEAIETLRDSICLELDIMHNCFLGNSPRIIEVLVQRVLDGNYSEGAVMCPPGDVEALIRIVLKLNQPKLLTFLLMLTNSQSLMIRMGSQHNLPVPSFIFQGGFILVESFDGRPLTNFYQSGLKLRLKTARELIGAILKFNSGFDHFRFYLMSMSPDDIMVYVEDDEKVKVTFVGLENVVIVNDLNETAYCNRPGQGQECHCIYTYGEMNLFSVCELLLENKQRDKQKGFLSNPDVFPEFIRIRRLLRHCVYCNPPNCKDRQDILEEIQRWISITFSRY